MEPQKAKILSTTLVISLLVFILVLRSCLDFHNHYVLFTSAACLVAIVLVFLWLLYQFSALDRFHRCTSTTRRSTLEGQQISREYSFLRKVAGVPVRFRLETLESATDRFTSVVGHGSSSTVFRGLLDDGSPVAVKRIESSDDNADRAFRAEVSAIASAQHFNLVRLIGYCLVPSGGPRFLVYDFIPNGSLDRWLFPTRSYDQQEQNQPKFLPWKVRYHVAIDVAKALAYLHHDCRHRVLHLDVKPENILLDDRFNAMVSDFGLSSLMRRDQSRVMATFRGTRGYLAPEWLVQRGVTEKSDVYSYGMVLFELVGGRRNVVVEEEEGGNRRWSYFPSIVQDKVKEGGNLMEILDDRLTEEEVPEEELRLVVWVALWCVQEEAKERPTMARVVDFLEGRITVEDPPITEMVIVDLLGCERNNGESSGLHVGVPSGLPEIRIPVFISGSISGSVMSTLSPR